MQPIVKEYITIMIIGALCLFFLINYMKSNEKETYASFEEISVDYPGDRVKLDKPCQTCDNIIEPSYLNSKKQPDQNEIYAQGIIDRQANQIRNLRTRIKDLADQLEDQGNPFYRRKLSNKYYKPRPFLANNGLQNLMNLNDDDFSNKTLSTIKFLSQTRESKYYGNEVHFPTELCGNYCSTSDPNRIYNSQVEGIRPIEIQK